MALDQKRHGHRTRGYNFESGKVIAAAPRSFHPGDTTQDSNDLGGHHSFPCMPCVNQHEHHREKISGDHNGHGININKLFNTAVARPVGRKMMENEDARKSMHKRMVGSTYCWSK